MLAQKHCIDCTALLPLDDFYDHPQMADGHLNKCKSCVCADVRKRREENETVREYDRARANLPHRKALRERTTREYREKNPERYKANTAVGNAVRDGRLKKGPCLFCGTSNRVHAHHADYSKPLTVKWLCVKCHRRLHAILEEHI